MRRATPPRSSFEERGGVASHQAVGGVESVLR
jgi:hypothetical protein